MNDFKAELVADDGTSHELSGKMSVGRTPSCDIFIDDPGVSRRHAEIRVEEESVILEDLGSANGTEVNGTRLLSPRELFNGDNVCFDECRFVVVVANDSNATIVNFNPTIRRPISELTPGPATSAAAPPPSPEPEPDPEPLAPTASNREPSASAAPDSAPAAPIPATIDDLISQTAGSAASAPPVATPGPVPPPSTSNDLPPAWLEDENEKQTQFIQIDREAEGPTPSPTDTQLQNRVSELPHLVVQMPTGQSYVLELETGAGNAPDVWELGRSPNSEIQLDEPSVSSRHAQLIHQKGRWKIVNLVSSNGIFINGEKRLNAFLADGDEVRLGLVTIMFRSRFAPGAAQGEFAGDYATNPGAESAGKKSWLIGGIAFVALAGAAALAWFKTDWFS